MINYNEQELSEKNDLQRCYCDKYAFMIINGESVQIEQAKEIIRVTDTFYSILGTSNQNGLKAREIADLLHIPYENQYGSIRASLKEIFSWMDRWGSLDVTFASNSFIGQSFATAEGWCHLDGTIYQVKRIGKYPDASHIYYHWRSVAQRFPFLNLGISILNDTAEIDMATNLLDVKKELSLMIKAGTCQIVDGQKVDVHAIFSEDGPMLPSFVKEYHQAIQNGDQSAFNNTYTLMQQPYIPYAIMQEWGLLAEQLFENGID